MILILAFFRAGHLRGDQVRESKGQKENRGLRDRSGRLGLGGKVLRPHTTSAGSSAVANICEILVSGRPRNESVNQRIFSDFSGLCSRALHPVLRKEVPKFMSLGGTISAKIRGCDEQRKVGDEMSWQGKSVFLLGCLVAMGALAAGSFAQQSTQSTQQAATDAPVTVVVIKGLSGVKDNTKGTLIIGDGSMHFAHEALKSDVATHSIEDVVTGDDSQRMIRGTLGTLSWFAPYGASRFLSLFRTKLDTVTIKYRDADGGLHGAIFTMPVGQAEVIKKDLLAQGARTTVTEADTKAAATATDAKEKQ